MTQHINTGTTQNSDPSTYSDTGQEGTSTPHKETLIPAKGHPGFEKIGGTNKDYAGTIPHAPVLDEFWKKPPRRRTPGVRFKNTARVRINDPLLSPKLRGDINIIDEFFSQAGGQGAPPERDKISNLTICAPTPDTVLLIMQSNNTEFPTLGKTGSEADHNFFPCRGPEKLEKWTDIIKRRNK